MLGVCRPTNTGAAPRSRSAHSRPPALGNDVEYRSMGGCGKRGHTEFVEYGSAERRPLHGQLQRLALDLDDRITQVVTERVGALGWPGRPVLAAPLPTDLTAGLLPAVLRLAAALRPATLLAGT